MAKAIMSVAGQLSFVCSTQRAAGLQRKECSLVDTIRELGLSFNKVIFLQVSAQSKCLLMTTELNITRQ